MEVNVERLKELKRERVLSLRELGERSEVSYNTRDGGCARLDPNYCRITVETPRRTTGTFLLSCVSQVIQERAWKDSNLRLAV
jgi:hypothetical protein